MGMDRNTVIGFILIGALLFGMLLINNKSKQAHDKEQKRLADSVAATLPKVDTLKQKTDSLAQLATQKKDAAGGFTTDSTEKIIKLSNEVMDVEFSTLGAQIKKVTLKNYKGASSDFVTLNSAKFNQFNYNINTANNKVAKITDLQFIAGNPVINSDKSQSISFTTKDSSGKAITHLFTIKPNDYLIDLNIALTGANQLISQNNLNITWQNETTVAEKIKKYESQQMHIDYAQNGKTDFDYIRKNDDKNFEKSLDWLSVKQQFFISAIAAKDKMSNASVKWTFDAEGDSTSTIATTTLTAKIPVANAANANVPLQFYFGPSDYKVLKKYNNEMDHIVPFGSGPFSFVKYINRYFLLPIWDFLKSHFANYGIVILLLTLLIRLITSPILYKSYLSGAKMKALKPEVDALKAKFTNPKTGEYDQQGFSMEQMKLWRSAGVSPLGGCVPALLQIPIFMSLFYFFQAIIDLRGKPFLWSKDLAAYDSIFHLPFNIPFYGDHVSLFTLTATLTSLLISLYGMSNMQDNSNPVMKYMPYIFPVLMLGFFNNLPSALTWYYTISNSITLILQIVIQKYIINPDKIRLQIAENMKKPAKQSKLQERIQAVQESQRKMQELKNKGKS